MSQIQNHEYIFTRRDLSVGQRVVQTAHALWEAKQFHDQAHLEHPHLVVLGVENEQELISVTHYLDSLNISYAGFRESYFDNELTAVATQPIFQDQRQLFSNYSLLQEIIKNDIPK